jgi:hypothetical protein
MIGKGPFPGMDPWLEQSWGDVHQRVITYASDQLNAGLPESLAARVEERVLVEAPISPDRLFVPDVRVVEFPTRGRPPGAAAGAAVAAPPVAAPPVAEPLLVDVSPVEVTEAYIEIRDFGSGGRVVTLIEVVSRSNKARGDGRDQYLRKQKEAMDARVNLVEIDLLRGGRGATMAAQRGADERVPCHYHASIYRATRPRLIEFFPISLRGPLPRLRIPLRPDDRDVTLDLQDLIARAYAAARYALTVDYDRDPEPPLARDDEKWAAEQIGAWRAQRAGPAPP